MPSGESPAGTAAPGTRPKNSGAGGSLLTRPQTISPHGDSPMARHVWKPAAPCPCRCLRCCSAICPPELGAHEGQAVHSSPGLVPGSRLGQLYFKMFFFEKNPQNYLLFLHLLSEDKNNNSQPSPESSFQPHPDKKRALYLSSLRGAEVQIYTYEAQPSSC